MVTTHAKTWVTKQGPWQEIQGCIQIPNSVSHIFLTWEIALVPDPQLVWGHSMPLPVGQGWSRSRNIVKMVNGGPKNLFSKRCQSLYLPILFLWGTWLLEDLGIPYSSRGMPYSHKCFPHGSAQYFTAAVKKWKNLYIRNNQGHLCFNVWDMCFKIKTIPTHHWSDRKNTNSHCISQRFCWAVGCSQHCCLLCIDVWRFPRTV